MKNPFENNQDVREYCRKKNVPLWKIAETLNISEPTMTRKMRSDLTKAEKDQIKKIADNLSRMGAKK